MAPTTLSTDSVRAYLRDIGRIPLLTNEEEIVLGRKVQRLMELEDIRKRLEKERGTSVDDAEVCAENCFYDNDSCQVKLKKVQEM